MYTDAVTGKQFECTELHSKWTTCKDCENSREKLTRTFANAAGQVYEALMGDYSWSSIQSAQEEFRVAKRAIEQAGGVVNGNHEVSWPEPQPVLPEIPSVGTDGLVRQYAVYNTGTKQFYTLGDGETVMSLLSAKRLAADLNNQMKPEFQNYTVVTIIFDPEV